MIRAQPSTLFLSSRKKGTGRPELSSHHLFVWNFKKEERKEQKHVQDTFDFLLDFPPTYFSFLSFSQFQKEHKFCCSTVLEAKNHCGCRCGRIKLWICQLPLAIVPFGSSSFCAIHTKYSKNYDRCVVFTFGCLNFNLPCSY